MPLNFYLGKKPELTKTSNISFIVPAVDQSRGGNLNNEELLHTMHLATVVRQTGRKVQVFAEALSDVNYVDVMQSAFVFVQASTETSTRAIALCDALSKHGISTCLTGTHFSVLPAEGLHYSPFILPNDFNSNLVGALSAMIEGKDLDTWPQISRRNADGSLHIHDFTGTYFKKANVWPDWTLLYNWNKLHRSFSIPVDFAAPRPISDILDEVRQYRNENINITLISADSCKDSVRLKAFLNSVRTSRDTLFKSWSGAICPALAADMELASLIARTKCSGITFDFSGDFAISTMDFSDGLLSHGEMNRLIENLTIRKINVHGIFHLGAEHDSPESINEIIDFACNSSISSVDFRLVSPMPGTDFYRKLHDSKRITVKDWAFYDGQHVTFDLPYIAPWELQDLLLKASRRFYNGKRAMDSLLKLQFKPVKHWFSSRKMNMDWLRYNSDFLKALKLSRHNINIPFRFDLNIVFADIYHQIQLATEIMKLKHVAI
ncbi:hypothetical protein KKF34_04620 [Myxococcota bacterium]|nr:hypothetical protein [Myxococcota bacterium]MBU1380023.1 hypothetical protein [Myxococcota bacterium]MBU1496143.1 hypothetical protein [Myxococcota bacterium]